MMIYTTQNIYVNIVLGVQLRSLALVPESKVKVSSKAILQMNPEVNRGLG